MKQELENSITKTCRELFHQPVEVNLTRPDNQFGDYSTNIALLLASRINQTSLSIADQLVKVLKESLAVTVSQIEIAGPGFINLRLRNEALLMGLNQEPAKTRKRKVVVAEYSDPNPFKVLHVGHLYTTIVGDSIARLLEVTGATVHRLNYGGDVGLHVGKTMWAVIDNIGGEKPDALKNIPEADRLTWLSERYVAGNLAYEENEQAKQAITLCNKRVYELYQNDDRNSPFAQIYWMCRDWSYRGFEKLYEELQIVPFERFISESEVVEPGLELVERGLAEGTLERSEGAVIFKAADGEDIHTRVFLNSEGLPTYEAKELGLTSLKWQEYNFDESIMITANDIVAYMKVVLTVAAVFYPESVNRTKHLTHGMVRLPGGQKMSSRRGNVLEARDILTAVDQANRTVTGSYNRESTLAAVKYGFLKHRLGGDIIYDPKELAAIEGNSGPYIQYAYARACSIIRKATQSTASLKVTADLQFQERSLLWKITEYKEVIDLAASELAPHHICNYLYELAQVFNRFYEQNRVVGDEREATRLLLVKHYAETLQKGLGVLGITAPERL
jgi:arginyl-tRNA synthetase